MNDVPERCRNYVYTPTQFKPEYNHDWLLRMFNYYDLIWGRTWTAFLESCSDDEQMGPCTSTHVPLLFPRACLGLIPMGLAFPQQLGNRYDDDNKVGCITNERDTYLCNIPSWIQRERERERDFCLSVFEHVNKRDDKRARDVRMYVLSRDKTPEIADGCCCLIFFVCYRWIRIVFVLFFGHSEFYLYLSMRERERKRRCKIRRREKNGKQRQRTEKRRQQAKSILEVEGA